MIQRKCFVCGDFEHIAHHYRNRESRQKEKPTQRFLNKFKVLKSRVINVGEGNEREIKKNRKTILKKEKLKKEKIVNGCTKDKSRQQSYWH